MKVTVEGKELVIRIELQTPTPSKSQRTLVIASTHGFVDTEAVVNTKMVRLSINAIIGK